MKRQRRLLFGDVLTARMLGSEAVYRVIEVGRLRCTVQVVHSPGLAFGGMFSMTRAAADRMEQS